MSIYIYTHISGYASYPAKNSDMFGRRTIGFSITVAKKLTYQPMKPDRFLHHSGQETNISTYQPMKPPGDSGTDPTWAILCGFSRYTTS